MQALAIWSHRAVGAALAIYLMERLADLAGEPYAHVPFVTSIVLVMALPEQPGARPYAIVAGHVLSSLAGYFALMLLGQGQVASAVAVGAAMLMMVAARAVHPPAGINAFLVPTHGLPLVWIASPVLAGSLILMAYALAWRWLEHRLTGYLNSKKKTPAEESFSRERSEV